MKHYLNKYKIIYRISRNIIIETFKNTAWKRRQDGEENVSELMEEQGNTEFDRNLVIEAGQKRGVVGRRGGKKAVKKRGGDRERKWGNREKRDESSPPSSTPPEEESREYIV